MSVLQLKFIHPECGTVNPNAAYCVNTLLPFISTTAMANVVDTDTKTARGLFDKLLEAAIVKTENAFWSELIAQCVGLKTISDIREVNLYGESVTGETTGYIEFNRKHLGPYQRIKVANLFVLFNFTGSVACTITDGVTVTTQSFDVTPGINRLEFNKVFQSPTGRIEFSNAYFEVGNCNDPCYYSDGYELGLYSNTNYYYYAYNCDSYHIKNNIGYQIMVVTDKQTFIELFKSELEYPLLYAYGILYYWNLLNTDRLNENLSQEMRQQAKENIANWDANSAKAMNTPEDRGEFWKSIHNLVNSIKSELANKPTVTEYQGYTLSN